MSAPYTPPGRVTYTVPALGTAQAADRAKALAKCDGWRVITVCRVRRPTDPASDEYVVELSVRPAR